MPSSRIFVRADLHRLLATAVAAAALVACGGSPSVLNDKKTFVDDAGMSMGEAGDTGSGGRSGINTDGGMLKMPEAGPFIEAGPGCGDGIVNQDSEECDDGNGLPGDGCSGACTKEDFSDCPPKGGPCTSTIVCGDGKLEGSEVCDDGNAVDGDGCSSDCLIADPNYDCSALAVMCINLVVCGDGKVTGDEQCDDAKNPHGCLDDCSGVEDGYLCSQPGKPCVKVKVAACGDGALDPGEQCDDGDNTALGDGCSSTCTVDTGWVCPTAGVKCLEEVCGNGVRTPDEECDDGNAIDGDGCSTSAASVASASSKCKVESGWVCPNAGKACIPKCGDGVKKGYETCEDGNAKSGDGCSSACLTEPGYVCTTIGAPCTKAVCGNNVTEADEGCDDGNTVYGDGCSGACQNEPTFSPAGVLNAKCGDGILTPSTGEVCDDGNTKPNDGCDALCKPEAGFQCTNVVASPDFISLAVTYHDVKGSDEAGGHPDFEHINQGEPGLVGDVCTPSNHGSVTNTCGTLNAQGKPQLQKVCPVPPNPMVACPATVTSPASFASWYSSDPTINKTIPGSLTLARQGTTGATYAFDSSAFFPLDGNALGFGPYKSSGHDFGFTTEIDYFFQYGGGETLTFRGDDDVWVFVNRKLAVDIGGVHGAEWGRVILGDESSSCSVGGAGSLGACTPTTLNSNADSRFDLQKGGIYQISLFHAERHTTQSNFKLTLSNFLPPHSQCIPKCGDGIVVVGEVCDDGAAANTGLYGACNSTCSTRQFCGDGIQNGPEACDNGTNLASYNATSGCSPGCVLPPKCGDGKVDFAFGEQCDKGSALNTGAYGGCQSTCVLGPFCGDKHADTPQETCDDGAANGGYGKSCGYDCEPGAYCGDGIKNGTEGCDLGAGKNVGGYGGCKLNCTQDIRCGDGVKNGTEQCDDGKNVGGYGKCAPGCVFGPRCGDGIKNGTEQCDDGTNDGSYGKCAKDCKYGPRCGDGVLQGPETCDDGAGNGTGDCSTSCQTQITR